DPPYIRRTHRKPPVPHYGLFLLRIIGRGAEGKRCGAPAKAEKQREKESTRCLAPRQYKGGGGPT
ncbi:MAG TPA: hypothetical protein VMS17_21380, partial [Gemmataceae bacterium]|nr:hypothetical protein [Gemmataceae bacterium]